MLVVRANADVALNHYGHRLRRTSKCRTFRLVHASVISAAKREDDLSPWVDWLLCIALIEMTERPHPMRMLEWIVAALAPGLRLTLGPLQMRNCSRGFDAMATVGLRDLQTACPSEVTEASAKSVARHWHGASTRQPGSSFSYTDALLMAAEVLLTQPVSRPSSGTARCSRREGLPDSSSASTQATVVAFPR